MRKFGIIILILIVSTVGTTTVSPATEAQEGKLKAYFIYNFTKFIKWPGLFSDKKFIIGIVGESDIARHLKTISSSKTVESLPIEIKNYEPSQKNHLVILPKNNSDKLQQILAETKNKPVLVITEKEGLGQQGSGINLLVIDNKIRFEINKSSLEKSGLTISSNLLKLAIKVY